MTALRFVDSGFALAALAARPAGEFARPSGWRSALPVALLVAVGVGVAGCSRAAEPLTHGCFGGNEAPRWLDDYARAADRRVLFLGNSFTFGNDLPGLVRQLARELDPERADVLTPCAAPGGRRLEQHLAAIEDPATETLARRALVTGPATLRRWDAIILQEQSQIAGFPEDMPERAAYATVAPALARHAAAVGATPVVLQTWGYRSGDPRNRERYPDYPTMQDHLTAGYGELARALSAPGRAARVAPAGEAFRAIHDAERRAGRDPTAAGSRFHALYAGDGKHPALPGSYLAACVLAEVLTGRDVRDARYAPPGLDPDEARRLREAAHRAVAARERAPR